MKKITYSAPGKVILSGEHAVVYGKPAFVTAVNLRLSVTIEESANIPSGMSEKIIGKVRSFIQTHKLKSHNGKCALIIASDIPIGRGLGSSAALSSAASGALLEFYTGEKHTVEIINNCAYSVEKLFHANPSGVDTASSCFGGLIFYRREFEFLKTISRLHSHIPRTIAQRLLLIDSGKPEESTAHMVELVGKLYNSKTAKTERALQSIEKCTKRFVVACVGNDSDLIIRAISENQKSLISLGVVSDSAQRLIRSLSANGVGKITGAGGRRKGSGYVLFYADDMEKTMEYLRQKKISYLPFSPSSRGVEKEL